MKKILFVFLFSLGLTSCFHKNQIQLKFLDEYVIPDSLEYKNSLIGGLSGVDYFNGYYYFVVDDSRNPRFLKSKITFNKDTISSINFVDVFFLNDSTEVFYKANALDLESIFVDNNTREINFVSEGFINGGKNPSVFKIDSLGKFNYKFKIPEYFNANSPQKPKHNASFESSSKSFDKKGFWVGMESVLESDGEHSTFTKKQSPIRITYFDNASKKATKQYCYQLEKIERPAKGNINLNGITAILEYKENNFFVIERTYQNGYKSNNSNIVKIFKASIEKKSTNTLELISLKNNSFISLKKELILDLSRIKDKLTNSNLDNIEGITFGPKLANGNQSLLLVSDDNFQKYGKQLNQFLLLEIIEK